jgi:transposase
MIYIRRIYTYTKTRELAAMTSGNTKRNRLKTLDVLNPHPERVNAAEFAIEHFFDPLDIVQVKYEMLRRVSVSGANKSDAAAEFGVSRPTYYQAAQDFQEAGLAGLVPKRRGPKGAHKLTSSVMTYIDQKLQTAGTLSASELAELVQRDLSLSVHPRSIQRALERKKKRRT